MVSNAKYLQSIIPVFSQIAFLIAQKVSFGIRSSSVATTEFVISYFFENYSLRSRFLAEKKDDFLLVKLTNSKLSLQDLDAILLDQIYLCTGNRFENITAVRDYLTNSKANLVILLADALDNLLIRSIYSYKFFLDDRVIYIKCVTQGIDESTYKVILDLDDKFVSELMANYLRLESIDVTKLQSVMNNVDGNLGRFFELLSDFASSKNNSEFSSADKVVYPSMRLVQKTSPIQKDRTKKYSADKKMNMDPSKFLTRREYDVFLFLRRNKFVSREDLMRIVWGDSDAGGISNNAIDQFISRLRKKFVKVGYPGGFIYTIKGKGVGMKEL